MESTKKARVMRKGVVSVVLPIYNVEKYLNRCIKSVINQSYKNLEIILVDDGSPDNCPTLCDEWAKKDNRIKVIHKKNAGLGMARNTGIANATGEYICFFDSDDYIAHDTIEKCLNYAQKDNADVVLFGASTVDHNGNIKDISIPHPNKNVYEGSEVQTEFLPDLISTDPDTGIATNLRMSVWGAFYSMQLLNSINWHCVSERDIIAEDVYSLLSLYKHVNKVSVISEALYYYCENDTSLTHIYRRDRYEKIKSFYDACKEECDKLDYDDKIKSRLTGPYLSFTIAALKLLVSSNESCKTKKELFKEIVFDNNLQDVLKITNLSHEPFGRKMLLMLIKEKKWRLSYELVRLKT